MTLDKANISTEWAGLRIKKAALENDEKFFRRLSTALCKDPLRTKRRQIRLAAVLFLFWPLCFQELRPSERFDFLEAAGFKAEEIPKEETLNRFLARCKFAEVWKGLSDELQRVVATLAVNMCSRRRKGPTFMGHSYDFRFVLRLVRRGQESNESPSLSAAVQNSDEA